MVEGLKIILGEGCFLLLFYSNYLSKKPVLIVRSEASKSACKNIRKKNLFLFPTQQGGTAKQKVHSMQGISSNLRKEYGWLF
jgi:hypothetical protein